MLQASEAIAEAHTNGIVHRDLKPSNLFVITRPDGALSIKVLDFGISKLTGGKSSGADDAMTLTAAVMGSPLYMSPEQIRSSKDVDSRADIWSLGIILFELLTGECPFVTATLPELVFQIVSNPTPSLRSKRSDIPPGLEGVVLRCLEKDRGKRFQTVAEMAIALLDFAPRRSKISVERISGIMRAAGFAGTGAVLPPSSDPSDKASPWSLTSGRARVAVAMAAALAFAVVVFWVLNRQSNSANAKESGRPTTTMVAASAAPTPAGSDTANSAGIVQREPQDPARRVVPVSVALPPTSPTDSRTEHKVMRTKGAAVHANDMTSTGSVPSASPATTASSYHSPLDIRPQ